MSKKEMLLGLAPEDWLELDLEDLEQLLGVVNAAFATKVKQGVETYQSKTTDLEEQRRKMLKLEPTIKAMFSSKPVKLNVGGTIFSTSLENLLREADTFFSTMFSGKWEVKYDPLDGSVFIDRDPTIFQVILNYMRTGRFDPAEFNDIQLQKLREEADYYQISSLLCLFHPQGFSSTRNLVEFSSNNTVATNKQVGRRSYALSKAQFSSSCMEMQVQIIKGTQIYIGVASSELIEAKLGWVKCGFFLACKCGTLGSQNGDKGTQYKKKPIKEGSIVTVRLDAEFNLSFAVDGEDWGVAYRSIAKDHSKPFHLAVAFGYSSTILYEGQVELLS